MSWNVDWTDVFWIVTTICCYSVALVIAKKAHFNPLLHPIVVTVALLTVCVVYFDTSIAQFQSSTSIIHWLLGPVTVALAIPIHNQWDRIVKLGPHVWISIGFGGVVAPLLAWFSVFMFNAPMTVQLTMILKSVSTPFAMAAAHSIGGIGELAAVFVIITGIVGAITAQLIFKLFRVTNNSAQGLALGTVAHAVGTSKAIQIGEEVAAMAILAMCINGVVTVIIVPFVISFYTGT